ncbi:MAG: hypothetical protein GXP32_03825 [Kiritimatiellaeota bacterium]|nr:hypothetical protein [Kiritimatiellota bacterium]
MTPKEIVRKTVAFEKPDRLARSFPEKYGNDFGGFGMNSSPDGRPSSKKEETDEWGAVWENIGICKMGEVKKFPLLDWADFDKLTIPDIRDPKRWVGIEERAAEVGDQYALCGGISMYERIHFIRGLENTWTDIYLEPDNLKKLLDILVDMNLYVIERYAPLGADGFIFCDDWGLQDRLMIQPDKWREIWKPAYAKVYAAAHAAGMQTFLHSCGFITDILDDLIEIGLDVIQMDQQLNMGLDKLGEFKGGITFWCPVDIQAVMGNHSLDDIRAYCHTLVETLGTPDGGFLPKWYGDPVGAGHGEEAVDAMCEEFLKIPMPK